ncbi:MAG: LysR family transcriptional regulator [Burkholderiaceae bacterium]|nr:LysR family transcriptional regulator [Burkholderiaceae bacterium]
MCIVFGLVKQKDFTDEAKFFLSLMGRKPTLEQLRGFIAAADNQSFAVAAKAVNKTPAAISMQMRQLEEIVRADLFVRGAKKATLTSAGEILLAYAREMLVLEGEALYSVRYRNKPALRVGILEIHMDLLAHALRDFHIARPEVRIEVVTASTAMLAQMLKDGALDVAAGIRGRQINGKLLSTLSVQWVSRSSRELWRRRPMPVALFSPGSVARTHAVTALQRAQIEYVCLHESSTLNGIIAAVNAGVVVSAIPSQSVNDTFRVLDSRDGFPKIEPLEVVLATNRQNNSAELEEFCAILAEVFDANELA